MVRAPAVCNRCVTRLTFCAALAVLIEMIERNAMSLTTHIDQLKKKHVQLSEKVEVAQRSPATNSIDITELKKEKLRLKEQISRLSLT